MHRFLWPSALALWTATAGGQVPLCAPSTIDHTATAITDEVQSFPGGEKALWQFLGTNVHYPDSAIALHQAATVSIRFLVTEDGTLTNVCTMRQQYPLLEAEAARVVGLMPKWIPAEYNGKPVPIWVTLPIKFEEPIAIDIGKPVPTGPDYKRAGLLLEKAGRQHQGAIGLMIFTSIGAATYAIVNQSKPEALGNAVIAVGVAQIIGTFINLSAGSNEKKAGWILQGLELEP